MPVGCPRGAASGRRNPAVRPGRRHMCRTPQNRRVRAVRSTWDDVRRAPLRPGSSRPRFARRPRRAGGVVRPLLRGGLRPRAPDRSRFDTCGGRGAGGVPGGVARGAAFRRAACAAIDLDPVPRASQGGRSRAPRDDPVAAHRSTISPNAPPATTFPAMPGCRCRREQVAAALAELSDPQREVIELAYFAGYTQTELVGKARAADRHHQISHPRSAGTPPRGP